MKTSDFKRHQPVTHIPPHPGPIEHGIVSSVTKEFVFVKFYPQLDRLGWDGTASQACNPGYLQHSSVQTNGLNDTDPLLLPKDTVLHLLSLVTKK